MDKLERAIADAKVVMTDLGMNSINTAGTNLKVAGHLGQLKKHLAVLDKFRNLPLLARIKDAMYDTKEDVERENALRHVVNLTYQLNRCLRCRCITCPMIDEHCRCEGCLYGSHVTECEGGQGMETRRIEKGVYMVDGRPAVAATFNRRDKGTIITLVDRNDVERRYRFDPATGRMFPV